MAQQAGKRDIAEIIQWCAACHAFAALPSEAQMLQAATLMARLADRASCVRTAAFQGLKGSFEARRLAGVPPRARGALLRSAAERDDVGLFRALVQEGVLRSVYWYCQLRHPTDFWTKASIEDRVSFVILGLGPNHQRRCNARAPACLISLPYTLC